MAHKPQTQTRSPSGFPDSRTTGSPHVQRLPRVPAPVPVCLVPTWPKPPRPGDVLVPLGMGWPLEVLGSGSNRDAVVMIVPRHSGARMAHPPSLRGANRDTGTHLWCLPCSLQPPPEADSFLAPRSVAEVKALGRALQPASSRCCTPGGGKTFFSN